MSLLPAAVALLRARGTSFAVIGAAAMAVHGVSRATGDLDLLVVDQACLSEAYWESLRPAGALVNIRRGDADDPLAGVVRLSRGTEPPLDVVVGKSAWQAAIPSRAAEASIEGTAVPVAGRADLILLKLYAGGPQDAWDIHQLLGDAERAATVAAVEIRLPALPRECRALWARVVSGPGDSGG